MSDMVFRGRRAADAAGDVYLASLPTRLDQRPEGWRAKLAEVRMLAGLLAALDPEDEKLVMLVADAIEDSTGGAPGSYSAARAALKALRSRIEQGEPQP